jgi:hypothetical protein
MSGLRAFLRTKRLDPDENLFNTTEDQQPTEKILSEDTQRDIDLRGHELDCLAFKIANDRSGEEASTWILMNSDAENGKSNKPDSTHEDWKRFQSSRSSSWRSQRNRSVRYLKWPWNEKSTSLSCAIWCSRARLGGLTSDTLNETLAQAWPFPLVKGRLESRNATKAISAAASILLPLYTTWGRRVLLGFACSSVMRDSKPYDTAIEASSATPFYIQVVNLMYGAWGVSLTDVEAAVSLTLYSCLLHRRAMKLRLKFLDFPEPIRVSRIIAASAGQSKEAVEKLVAQIELWACFPGREVSSVEYITIESVNITNGLPTLWAIPSKDNKVYTPVSESSGDVRGVAQFCGWSAMPHRSISSKGTYVVATYPTNESLVSLCAQEIFSTFLYELSGSKDLILPQSLFVDEPKNLGIQNPIVTELIGTFTENGLGSTADAMLCTIPTLVAAWPTLSIPENFSKMLHHMEGLVKRGAMNAGGLNALIWGKRCLVLGLTDEQIWRWFLISSWYCHASNRAHNPNWMDLKSTSTTLSTSEKTAKSDCAPPCTTEYP